jgi:cytochrome oxidase assembly protein ShyY1
MTDTGAFLAWGLPGVTAAVLGFINNWQLRRVTAKADAHRAVEAERSISTIKKLDTLNAQTDGIVERLVRVTGESERAKGVLQEKQRANE